MIMNYFIPGNHPALSAAELAAIFASERLTWLPEARLMLLEGELPEPSDSLIRRIGGIVKIGQITDELMMNTSLEETAMRLLKAFPERPGRVDFGLSLYGVDPKKLKPLAMTMKRLWRDQGHPVRWVVSKGTELSSASIGENHLIEAGAELVLIRRGNMLLIGRTTAIQDYRGLSDRDYGRPGRDDRSGMLPPKLAQIMLNLAQTRPEHAVLDPFCGSGTVLMEARLLGCRALTGIDASAKAVADSRKNLDWLAKEYGLPIDGLALAIGDAATLDSVKTGSIDRIITEPYLGPARGHHDPAVVGRELEPIYSSFLRAALRAIKPDGRLVMILPTWPAGRGFVRIDPRLDGWRQVLPLPKPFTGQKYMALTDRHTLLYGRPHQRVWREIIILETK